MKVCSSISNFQDTPYNVSASKKDKSSAHFFTNETYIAFLQIGFGALLFLVKMRESFSQHIPILTRLQEYFVENIHGNVKQGGGGSRDKHPTSLGYLHRLITGLLREVDEVKLGYKAPPLRRSSGSFADSWKPTMMLCKYPKNVCVFGCDISGEACSCTFSDSCERMNTVPHQNEFKEIAKRALSLNPNMTGLKEPDDALNASGAFSLLVESEGEDEEGEENDSDEQNDQSDEDTADFYDRISYQNNNLVDSKSLGEFQRIQKASAKVNLLVASMPTNREDRPGFDKTISASDFYYLATEHAPLGRPISLPVNQKRMYRGDFGMVLTDKNMLSLVEILIIRGNTVTKGGKQRVAVDQLFSAVSPFTADIVFLYRQFGKSPDQKSGVFYSRLDQIWEYESAVSLSFIIPKDRVTVAWNKGYGRWHVDIGSDVAKGFIDGDNRGVKRKWM
jgi:hypothetical protein